MTTPRRLSAIIAIAVSSVLWAAPAAMADDLPGGDDNAAVAVNTEDGASVFRLAFSVRMVANGVVDQTNSAYALASCTDCQTVALALQVVLVWGDANVVVPENTAVAYNDQCVECLTYASATQIVLGFDGPVRFTDEGRRRLAAMYQALRDLEDQAGDLSLAQLNAAIQAAKTELVAILEEELEPVPQGSEAGGTTTTSAAPGESTTTTTGEPTSSTAPPTSAVATTTTTTTSTSTTTEPSSTTSSSAPASSTTTTAAETTTTTAAG
jgi:putative peptide zinc metalloprotease protein